MRYLFVLFLLLIGSWAQAVDLDMYVGQQGQYIFNGKAADPNSYAQIDKEEVFVAPLNQTMVRYIFRSHYVANRPELAFFTIYKNSEGEYFSYMRDRAYLPSATESFQNISESTFNSNQWVPLKVSEKTIEGIFYPGDLGELKFKFEFQGDRILVHTWMWEQLFGMIPLPRHDVNEFRY